MAYETTDTAGQQKVAVHCPSCNRKFKVGPKRLGKTAKCPCGTKFKLELPEAVAKVPDPEPEPDDLYGFADDDEITGLSGGGGADILKPVEPSTAASPVAMGTAALNPALGGAYGGPQPKRRIELGEDGDWKRGTLYAIGGLLAAVALWVALRASIDKNYFGFMATVLGCGIGGGYALGLKTPSKKAAWISALLAIGGFALAKTIIFTFITLPAAPGQIEAELAAWEAQFQEEMTEELDLPDGYFDLDGDRLIALDELVEQTWDEREYVPGRRDELRWDEEKEWVEARDAAFAQVELMSDEEVADVVVAAETRTARQQVLRENAEEVTGRVGDRIGQSHLDDAAERMAALEDGGASLFEAKRQETIRQAYAFDQVEAQMRNSAVMRELDDVDWEDAEAWQAKQAEVQAERDRIEAEVLAEVADVDVTELKQRMVERQEAAAEAVDEEWAESWRNFDDVDEFQVELPHIVAFWNTFHCADPIFLIVSMMTAAGLAANGTLNK